MSFEPTEAHNPTTFIAQGLKYRASITSRKLVLYVNSRTTFQLTFEGTNAHPSIEPLDRLPGLNNYLIGKNPTQWRTNVPRYGRLAIRNLCRGIDLIFYGKDGQLEYDWQVSPGADPSKIRLKTRGAAKRRIDSNGDLVFEVGGAEIRQRKPDASQEGRAVDARYVEYANEIALRITNYDPTKPLLIDPTLIYSTYLGTNSSPLAQTAALAVAIDPGGNVYIAGHTDGPLLLSTNGTKLDDEGGFVAKLDPQGKLVYTTYLGVSCTSIAVDANGNAYVLVTGNGNFPLVNPLQSNRTGALVAKLNPQGNAIVYSTYLGGRSATGNAIAVDSIGNLTLVGSCFGDLPIRNAFQPNFTNATDGFVVKITSQGDAVVFASYLGGFVSNDARAVAIDSNGNSYVTGYAGGGLPIVNAVQPLSSVGGKHAFLTKISPQGILVYSTYLGGAGIDTIGNGVAVDASGNAYVGGQTAGSLQVVNAVQPTFGGGNLDAFVIKINPQGTGLVYSTYLGSTHDDVAISIAADSDGNAYVIGVGLGMPYLNPIFSGDYGF